MDEFCVILKDINVKFQICGERLLIFCCWFMIFFFFLLFLYFNFHFQYSCLLILLKELGYIWMLSFLFLVFSIGCRSIKWQLHMSNGHTCFSVGGIFFINFWGKYKSFHTLIWWWPSGRKFCITKNWRTSNRLEGILS